ncbi:MAG: type II secretion system F family protein [Chthoniobacterales bacterium]
MQLSARDKEALFNELSVRLRSGMPFRESLEQIAVHSSRLRSIIGEMLRAGQAPEECFNAVATRFDEIDLDIIVAGVHSGGLDRTFAELAEYYAYLLKSKNRFIGGLYYPVFIFHFGILVLNLNTLVVGPGLGEYLRQVISALVVFYLLFIGAFVILRFFFAIVRSNATLQRRVRHIPILGSLPYQLALWRFSLVTSLLAGAGIGIYKALEMASGACKNSLIQTSIAEVIVQNRTGVNLSQAFANTHAFPEIIVRHVSLAESTGRVQLELNNAAKVMQGNFQNLLNLLSRLLPKLIYLLILAFMVVKAFQLISQTTAAMNSVLPPE